MTITADECRRLLREADGVERVVADEIVERFETTIRRCVQQGQKKTMVTIPEFLYGTPAFDRKDVEERVKAVFCNGGFSVKPIEGYRHTFFICWDGEEDVIEEKSKTVQV